MHRIPTNRAFSRRQFLTAAATGAAGVMLASCTTVRREAYAGYPSVPSSDFDQGPLDDQGPLGGQGALDDPAVMYGPLSDGGFEIPPVPYQKIDPKFYRQIVPDPTGEMPGTLVVDTPTRFLYLVQEGGQALRYGVGIGRQGFAWKGRAVVQWKQKWPKWTPPDDMIARQPELAKYSADNGGMPPGLDNPLGARAMYLFQNNVDTLYRIHGSPEWWSIGKAVSSGCVRLINQDVIDLYDRVPVKTPVLVI